MKQFSDIFKKEDEKELQKQDQEATESIRLTGDIARSCLGTSQFKRYKEQYIKTEAKICNLMLQLTEAYLSGKFSLEEYGVKTVVYMTRLKDLRSLLEVVTRDSRKGLNDGKEEI